MLRSAKELIGYTIVATDGEIGRVHDLYFDDQSWGIRYLVADTGTWLSGRRVLLSTASLAEPDWGSESLPVSLTRDRVRTSPDADLDKPVSRQKEIELHTHYGWPVYWQMGGTEGMPPAMPEISPPPTPTVAPADEFADPTLRSVREVINYHIEASDGEIGHAQDFILETDLWVMRYLVVDTRNWLPGRKVLVSPQWLKGVSWEEAKVIVDLPRSTIEKSPSYDPSEPVNREYEVRLYDYYGRPHYWSS
jgi:hypothetical protein